MSSTLQDAFTNIEPFRSSLLRLLLPFDIAKLLAASRCNLSSWERKTYMDVIDDILEDSSDLVLMRHLGLTIRIFGSDLKIMVERLRDPCSYLAKYGKHHSFHIFFVATSQHISNPSPTLIHDFRPVLDRHLVPEDISMAELAQTFDSRMSTYITVLSKWILCAPYLSGSLSIATPGWVPVFNGQENVNIRAYISTFSGCNSRILHMDRALISRVFGFHNSIDILLNLSNLTTTCIILQKEKREIRDVKGRLVMDYIRSVLVTEMEHRPAHHDFIVTNSIHPTASAIIIDIG